MADTLSVELKASVSWLFTDASGLTTIVDNARVEYARSTVDGVGADQADKIWHDTRSVAAGANDDLDLTALPRTLFGGTVSLALAKVKALVLVNVNAATGEKLVVGGGATHAFDAPFGGVSGSKVEVGPDSVLVLSNKRDGWSVVDGASDVLRVTNPGSTSVAYKIVIVGTSV